MSVLSCSTIVTVERFGLASSEVLRVIHQYGQPSKDVDAEPYLSPGDLPVPHVEWEPTAVPLTRL